MPGQVQQTLLAASQGLTSTYTNGVATTSLMFNPIVNSINNTNSITTFQNGSINNVSIGSLQVTHLTAQSGTVGNFTIDSSRIVSNDGNLVLDSVNDQIIISFQGIPQIILSGSS